MNIKSAIIIAVAVLLGAAGVIVQKEMHVAEARRAELQLAERAKLKALIEQSVAVCNAALSDIRSDDWTLTVQAFQVDSLKLIGKLDDWMDANQKDTLIAEVFGLRNELEGFRHEFNSSGPDKPWPPLPKFARKLKDFSNKL